MLEVEEDVQNKRERERGGINIMTGSTPEGQRSEVMSRKSSVGQTKKKTLDVDEIHEQRRTVRLEVGGKLLFYKLRSKNCHGVLAPVDMTHHKGLG